MKNSKTIFKENGYSQSFTSNGVGIRLVKGRRIFMWYPTTGTLMVRTNIGQKKIGTTLEAETAVAIMAGHA